MFRATLILLLSAVLTLYFAHRSIEFPVLHFLQTPLWLLPFYYWWNAKRFKHLAAGGLIFVTGQVYVCLHLGFFRIAWLWLLCLGIFSAVLFLREYFKVKNENHSRAVNAKNDELNVMKKKFESRQQSLEHLERQVTSLLNLFEIARELSEAVDFTRLAESLSKTLANELSFDKVGLWILWRNKDSEQKKKMRKIQISERKASIIEGDDNDLAILGELQEKRQMLRVENIWYFPAFDQNDLYAVFSIENAQEKDLAKIEVLSAFLSLLVKKISLYEMIRELAIIDDLTQVFVRRHFMERLNEEIKRSHRFKTPISLLMLDIDHFKRYNDEFGHLVGDATLKKVAEIIKMNVRRVDLVGRYGGEEFIVVMPETMQPAALEVAERIRSSVARHTFKLYNVETKMTVSLGLATYNPLQSSLAEGSDYSVIVDRLIQVADKCLYQAKDDGRNRVMVFKELV